MKKNILISLLIIVIAGVIGLISAVVKFTVVDKPRSYGYSYIEFSYNGASDGLDPNGNAFSPVDLLDEDVIKKALVAASLDTTYEAKEVAANIIMEGVVPKDIIGQLTSYTSLVSDKGSTRTINQTSYHPTKFRLTLYSDFANGKAAKTDASMILDCVVKEYLAKFNNLYTNNFDLTDYVSVFAVEGNDYLYQVEAYQTKLTIIASYANTLYNQHTDFVNADGLSFADINLKCNNLKNNEISKINYSIKLNALSNDLDRLENYYKYKVLNYTYEKTKYEADQTALNSVIGAYTKDSTIYITSGDSVIKVDSNSASKYDSLLEKKISVANRISSITTNISDYNSRLTDIAAASADDSEYVLLQKNIDDLANKYAAVEASFKSLLNDYNQKYISNDCVSATVVKYHSSSIASTSFIAQCVKSCGPLVMIACLGIAFYFFVKETKKSKVK